MKLFYIFLFFTLASCQSEERAKQLAEAEGQFAKPQNSSAKDDFSDFKKKDDESCDSEKDLEKKFKEQAKKKEAFSLQGADSGCASN